MTRTAISGLVLVGGFVALLVATWAALIKLDEQGVRGTLIGAGLGLLNLTVGYLVMRRTLRRNMRSAMATLVGGFLARLLLLAGLTVFFQRSGAADATAFALTFLIFFFVYLGVEVLMVERSLDDERKAH